MQGILDRSIPLCQPNSSFNLYKPGKLTTSLRSRPLFMFPFCLHLHSLSPLPQAFSTSVNLRARASPMGWIWCPAWSLIYVNNTALLDLHLPSSASRLNGLWTNRSWSASKVGLIKEDSGSATMRFPGRMGKWKPFPNTAVSILENAAQENCHISPTPPQLSILLP